MDSGILFYPRGNTKERTNKLFNHCYSLSQKKIFCIDLPENTSTTVANPLEEMDESFSI